MSYREVHVCRGCGRRDTTHRSQICGQCVTHGPDTSDPWRKEDTEMDRDGTKRRVSPGPPPEMEDDQ